MTLKMADADVKLLYDVAKNVAMMRQAHLDNQNENAFLSNFDRLVNSRVVVQQLQDIAGALNVALRGNQR